MSNKMIVRILTKLAEVDNNGMQSNEMEEIVADDIEDFIKDENFEKLSSKCILRIIKLRPSISSSCALTISKIVGEKNQDDLIELLKIIQINDGYSYNILEILKCITNMPVLSLALANLQPNQNQNDKPQELHPLEDNKPANNEAITPIQLPNQEIPKQEKSQNEISPASDPVIDLIDSVDVHKSLKKSDSDSLSFSEDEPTSGPQIDDEFVITVGPPVYKSAAADLTSDTSDFNPYMTLNKTIISSQSEYNSGNDPKESIRGALKIDPVIPDAQQSIEPIPPPSAGIPPVYPSGELSPEPNHEIPDNTDLYNKNTASTIVDTVKIMPFQAPQPQLPPPPEVVPCQDIFEAASKGNVEELKRFIQEGVNPMSTDKNGWTPLHHCGVNGNMQCVKELLKYENVNVIALTNCGQMPIHIGALRGHYEFVAYLLNRGSDIDTPDLEGFTPLMYACEGGNEKIVNILIYAGAKVNTSTPNGLTPLNIAARAQSAECIDSLLKSKAKVEPSKNALLSPFYISVCKNDVKSAKLLLENGANVNSQDKKRVAPIHIAAQEGNVEMIKLILSNGGKIELVNKAKERPLFIAAKCGHVEAVKALIELGANVDAQQENGNTPLHIAVISQNLEIVKLLLEANANQKIKNKKRKYPKDIPTTKEISDLLSK